MKSPEVGQMLFINKNVNQAEIVAVYDGSKQVGSSTIYSVKVASGDIYDCMAYNDGWKAVN